ncbi:MAG: hypothetical protein K0R08_2271 [Solimicrobium sp.]|nr:hypothetical protein [Solimicrobium sp.]
MREGQRLDGENGNEPSAQKLREHNTAFGVTHWCSQSSSTPVHSGSVVRVPWPWLAHYGCGEVSYLPLVACTASFFFAIAG